MALITDLLAKRYLMQEFKLTDQQLNIISLVQILHLRGEKTTMGSIVKFFKLKGQHVTLASDLIKLRESGYLTYQRNKRGQRVNMNFYSPGVKSYLVEARYKELCADFAGSRI